MRDDWGWVRDCPIKGIGLPVGNFEETPLDPVCGHGLELFHPLEVPVLKQHKLALTFFGSVVPKRYCESCCCGPEHLKRYQIFFEPLKSMMSKSFSYTSTPSPGGRGGGY